MFFFWVGWGGGGSDLDSVLFYLNIHLIRVWGSCFVLFFLWGVGRERFIWDPQTISLKKSDHHDIDHPDGWIGLFASLLTVQSQPLYIYIPTVAPI